MYVCGYVHAMACMWSLEDLQWLVLSYHRVSPGDQIQVIRFGYKSLYFLSLYLMAFLFLFWKASFLGTLFYVP